METHAVPPEFVEFIALVYHEGRNVGRLFRLNAASKKTFGELAALPPESEKAWDRLIGLQKKAAAAASAAEAQAAFHESFGCSMADLVTLFGHEAWHRVPGYGGPRWAAIAKSVAALAEAIEKKDEAEVSRQIGEILAMRHNTGTVRDKLAKLKALHR